MNGHRLPNGNVLIEQDFSPEEIERINALKGSLAFAEVFNLGFNLLRCVVDELSKGVSSRQLMSRIKSTPQSSFRRT